jgi:hypothetical protein
MKWIACAATAGLAVFATQLMAQTPPHTGSWTPGWTAKPGALVHVSGLKCPTAAWKGYDTTAPEYFNSDSWYGVKTDAVCQYSVDGMDLMKTFTVNLVRTSNVAAAAEAEYKNAQIVAQRRTASITPSFAKLVRRTGTYRLMSYTYPFELHHRHWIVTRDKDGQNVMVSAYFPSTMSEEKVWAVAEQLFAANP